MTRAQGVRRYTLAEIDSMRQALTERWVKANATLTADGGWICLDGDRVGDVERQLHALLVGNVDPIDVLAECARYLAPQQKVELRRVEPNGVNQ